MARIKNTPQPARTGGRHPASHFARPSGPSQWPPARTGDLHPASYFTEPGESFVVFGPHNITAQARRIREEFRQRREEFRQAQEGFRRRAEEELRQRDLPITSQLH